MILNFILLLLGFFRFLVWLFFFFLSFLTFRACRSICLIEMYLVHISILKTYSIEHSFCVRFSWGMLMLMKWEVSLVILPMAKLQKNLLSLPQNWCIHYELFFIIPCLHLDHCPLCHIPSIFHPSLGLCMETEVFHWLIAQVVNQD